MDEAKVGLDLLVVQKKFVEADLKRELQQLKQTPKKPLLETYLQFFTEKVKRLLQAEHGKLVESLPQEE